MNVIFPIDIINTNFNVIILYKQIKRDKPVIAEAITERNHLQTSEYHQARLKAVSAPHAGDWLFALGLLYVWSHSQIG